MGERESMVERVARAIYEKWAEAEGATTTFDNLLEVVREGKRDFAPRCAWAHDLAFAEARAAIEAMRDPPSHVIAAIEAKAEERYFAAPAMQRWYGDDVWNAGVEAALAEQPDPTPSPHSSGRPEHGRNRQEPR